MNDHENGFVSAFVLSERRERYRELLANPKRRSKILERLSCGKDIDFSRAQPVPVNCDLARLLEELGAGPTCYVMADVSEMDGQEMPLREALWQAQIHSFGVVVSCLAGSLCYYKPESPTPGFILQYARRP